jgi:hypothetical protein
VKVLTGRATDDVLEHGEAGHAVRFQPPPVHAVLPHTYGELDLTARLSIRTTSSVGSP